MDRLLQIVEVLAFVITLALMVSAVAVAASDRH